MKLSIAFFTMLLSLNCIAEVNCLDVESKSPIGTVCTGFGNQYTRLNDGWKMSNKIFYWLDELGRDLNYEQAKVFCETLKAKLPSSDDYKDSYAHIGLTMIFKDMYQRKFITTNFILDHQEGDYPYTNIYRYAVVTAGSTDYDGPTTYSAFDKDKNFVRCIKPLAPSH